MRALNIEELSAVSGGQSNEAEVVVTAGRRNPNSIYMSDIAMTGMSLGDYLFGMQMDADGKGDREPCPKKPWQLRLACEAGILAAAEAVVKEILPDPPPPSAPEPNLGEPRPAPGWAPPSPPPTVPGPGGRWTSD